MSRHLPGFLMLGAVLGTAIAAEPELPHAFAAGWKGEPVCTVLRDDPQLRVARCEFPPGVGHEPHYHEPHFGYVLEGGLMRMSDENGDRTLQTPAGTTWSSEDRSQHHVLNVGDTTASYLIIEPRE